MCERPLTFSARLKIHRQNVSSSSAASSVQCGQPLEDVDSDGDDDREDEGDGDGDKLLTPWTAQPADLAEWLPLSQDKEGDKFTIGISHT